MYQWTFLQEENSRSEKKGHEVTIFVENSVQKKRIILRRLEKIHTQNNLILQILLEDNFQKPEV